MTNSLVQACSKSSLLDCFFLEDERWRIADFAVYYYRHNPPATTTSTGNDNKTVIVLRWTDCSRKLGMARAGLGFAG